MHIPLLFCVLQALDAGTTLYFLRLGIEEANPLVEFFMQALGSPLLGLLYAKGLAFLLLVHCVRHGRKRVLRWAMCLYTLLFAWNIFAIFGRVRMWW